MILMSFAWQKDWKMNSVISKGCKYNVRKRWKDNQVWHIDSNALWGHLCLLFLLKTLVRSDCSRKWNKDEYPACIWASWTWWKINYKKIAKPIGWSMKHSSMRPCESCDNAEVKQNMSLNQVVAKSPRSTVTGSFQTSQQSNPKM